MPAVIKRQILVPRGEVAVADHRVGSGLNQPFVEAILRDSIVAGSHAAVPLPTTPSHWGGFGDTVVERGNNGDEKDAGEREDVHVVLRF